MERMGHSSTRAALIYLHATRERDEAIAAGMGQLFTNAKKTATKPSRSGTRPPTCPLKIKKLNDHSPDLGRNHTGPFGINLFSTERAVTLRATHLLRPSPSEVRLHFSSISCIMMQ